MRFETTFMATPQGSNRQTQPTLAGQSAVAGNQNNDETVIVCSWAASFSAPTVAAGRKEQGVEEARSPNKETKL